MTLAMNLTIPSLCPATSSCKFVFLFTFSIVKKKQTQKVLETEQLPRALSLQDLSLAFLSQTNKHFLESIAHHFCHFYMETEASGKQEGRN